MHCHKARPRPRRYRGEDRQRRIYRPTHGAGRAARADGFEDAAPDSSARDRRAKPFDGVDPRGGRRGEVEGPSWMRGEPSQDIGMFVRGVIVDDGVNELAAWHGAVHRLEKSDELLMPMLVHAMPDHGSVEDV